MTAAVRRPNFFILGAQKCGTTWLARVLARQPGIYLPPEKEPHYFTRHFDRGEGWYLRHFDRDGAAEAVAVGEATPNYLAITCAANAPAAERIRRFAPEARFVVILRNPVDRFLSAYKHHAARGRLPWVQGPDQHIEALLDNRLKTPAILDYGLYGAQLARYFELFDPAQFRVFVFEETLPVNPAALVREIAAFLGLPGQEPSGPLSRRENVTVETRAGIIATNLLSGWMRCDAVRHMAGGIVTGVGRAVDALSGQAPFVLSAHIRRRLEAHYAEDIEHLRRLLGRAQPLWPQAHGEAPVATPPDETWLKAA